jgi:NAD(P)-dependent dehydrogenase (short-subunit alcohol dehydrogenase family)
VGSGIGRAIAAELAARDHAVVVTDLSLAADEATAGELGGDATALALDVTDAAQAKSVAATVAQTRGAPDVWVSNAGLSKTQPFTDITPDDLRRAASSRSCAGTLRPIVLVSLISAAFVAARSGLR